MLLTEIKTLDEVLQSHAESLGSEALAYNNHAYRVANFCAALSSREPDTIQKIAIAAAFHDLGIWTASTFDYLRPSRGLACEYLARVGKSDWGPEISAMILEHHKITPYREHDEWLVEPFRRADCVDVTRGLRRFGLPSALLREVFSTWPDAGFHRGLVGLSLRRLRSHPLSPLPMFRL